MPAGTPFDVLRQFRRRHHRRRCQQHVDVIRRYRPTYDHYLPCLTDLPNQIACPLRHSPAQYLVPVFCTPDQVILQIVNCVRAMPVLRHLLHSRRRGTGRWKRTASKAVGLDRADGAKKCMSQLRDPQRSRRTGWSLLTVPFQSSRLGRSFLYFYIWFELNNLNRRLKRHVSDIVKRSECKYRKHPMNPSGA
jgi:hypothetical protein